MFNQPHKYWQSLRQLMLQCQRTDDEGPLCNPYLQIAAMMNQ